LISEAGRTEIAYLRLTGLIGSTRGLTEDRVISPFRRSLAGQAENDSDSTINLTEFVARQQTVRLTQAAGVYGAKLFD
jgi:hypothetical protein